MNTFDQIHAAAPSFTEKSLVDLSSKVYLITGATSGIGLSLATLLYSLHATIYIGARCLSRYESARTSITSAHPESKGELRPFVADLSSPSTLGPAIANVLATSYRLDVLFLNAGVMMPPRGSKTHDGYDLEMGVNCLASFLLVQQLSPLMSNVSAHFCHANPSIRVVWVSALLNNSTPDGGVQLLDESTGAPKQFKAMHNYMRERTDEHGIQSRNPHGVLHVVVNPGSVKSELHRYTSSPIRTMMGAILKNPKYGAYTELYAGLAPNVNDGDFVLPWGRKGEAPEHIVASMKTEEGKKTVSARFYEWCEEQVKPFMAS
ncbi:NAD(P)-binding protein [Pleomassaria siparia CBS 279.74]|uniref:NAD(P)-binding protein n=1 Tax=Pleomassaria siparia CBS 279.74 TaxID=1314801 RepID=A0A6G1KJ40_9PLEO|nr:NAD(P)-binding protein [Pleomassaria siparia CBS 279.74]